MQSSDTGRARRAKTYYLNKINEAALLNPSGDCLTAQCTKFTACNIQFPSFELRQLFIEGKNLYWACEATTGGCRCGQ